MNGDIFLILYDLTRRETFDNVEEDIQLVYRILDVPDGDAPIVIVG